MVITLEPTFLVLNTETLSMYVNENINSLMDSMPLADLTVQMLDDQKNTKTLAEHNHLTCFTLSLNKNPNHEIMCLESKMAARNWVDAI